MKFSATAFLGLAALLLSLTNSPFARADRPEIDIVPAEVKAGPQASWFQCPCFRWVLQVQGPGGKVETRDFLISSEALFKFHDEASMDFQRHEVQLFKVGSVEALWKSGHVGMGFNGVTWGEDRDRGYSDILRTGFYGLVNLFLTQAARMDIHSGLDFETMRVNLGPKIGRGMLEQAAVLKWKTGAWSGNVSGRIGLDAKHMLDPDYFTAGASAGVRARIFSLQDLEMGLGFDVSYDHDGLRNFMGLVPDLLTGSLMMDLSYVTTNHE